jgi:hypothetical protein
MAGSRARASIGEEAPIPQTRNLRRTRSSQHVVEAKTAAAAAAEAVGKARSKAKGGGSGRGTRRSNKSQRRQVVLDYKLSLLKIVREERERLSAEVVELQAALQKELAQPLETGEPTLSGSPPTHSAAASEESASLSETKQAQAHSTSDAASEVSSVSPPAPSSGESPSSAPDATAAVSSAVSEAVSLDAEAPSKSAAAGSSPSQPVPVTPLAAQGAPVTQQPISNQQAANVAQPQVSPPVAAQPTVLARPQSLQRQPTDTQQSPAQQQHEGAAGGAASPVTVSAQAQVQAQAQVAQIAQAQAAKAAQAQAAQAQAARAQAAQAAQAQAAQARAQAQAAQAQAAQAQAQALAQARVQAQPQVPTPAGQPATKRAAAETPAVGKDGRPRPLASPHPLNSHPVNLLLQPQGQDVSTMVHRLSVLFEDGSTGVVADLRRLPAEGDARAYMHAQRIQVAEAPGLSAADAHAERRAKRSREDDGPSTKGMTRFQQAQAYEEQLKRYRSVQEKLHRTLESRRRPLPPWKLERRKMGHWNHLLCEMSSMATDFFEERKWKKAAAGKTSRAAALKARAASVGGLLWAVDGTVARAATTIAAHVQRFPAEGISKVAAPLEATAGGVVAMDVDSAVGGAAAVAVAASQAEVDVAMKRAETARNASLSSDRAAEHAAMSASLLSCSVRLVPPPPQVLPINAEQQRTVETMQRLLNGGAGVLLSGDGGRGKTVAVAAVMRESAAAGRMEANNVYLRGLNEASPSAPATASASSGLPAGAAVVAPSPRSATAESASVAMDVEAVGHALPSAEASVAAGTVLHQEASALPEADPLPSPIKLEAKPANAAQDQRIDIQSLRRYLPPPQLVLCGGKGLLRWCAELSRACPSLCVRTWEEWREEEEAEGAAFETTQPGVSKPANLSGTDVVLCSHEACSSDEIVNSSLVAVPWRLLVLDCRDISRSAIAWRKIPKAGRRIAISCAMDGERAVEGLAYGVASFLLPSAFPSPAAAEAWERADDARRVTQCLSPLSVGLECGSDAKGDVTCWFMACPPPPSQRKAYDAAVKQEATWSALAWNEPPQQAANGSPPADYQAAAAAAAVSLLKKTCQWCDDLSLVEPGPISPPAGTPSGGQKGKDKSEPDSPPSVLAMEAISGKLQPLAGALKRLSAAGKRAIILAEHPKSLRLIRRYLLACRLPHDCCGDVGELQGGAPPFCAVKGMPSPLVRSYAPNTAWLSLPSSELFSGEIGAWLRGQCAVWRAYRCIPGSRTLLISRRALLGLRDGGLRLPRFDSALVFDGDAYQTRETLLSFGMGLGQGSRPTALVKLYASGTIEEAEARAGAGRAALRSLLGRPVGDVLRGKFPGNFSAEGSDKKFLGGSSSAASAVETAALRLWERSWLAEEALGPAMSVTKSSAAALQDAVVDQPLLTPIGPLLELDMNVVDPVLDPALANGDLSMDPLIYEVDAFGPNGAVAAFAQCALQLKQRGIHLDPYLHCLLPPLDPTQSVPLLLPSLRMNCALEYNLSLVDKGQKKSKQSSGSRPSGRKVDSKSQQSASRKSAAAAHAAEQRSRRQGPDTVEDWIPAEDALLLLGRGQFGSNWGLFRHALDIRAPTNGVTGRLRSMAACRERLSRLQSLPPGQVILQPAEPPLLLPPGQLHGIGPVITTPLPAPSAAAGSPMIHGNSEPMLLPVDGAGMSAFKKRFAAACEAMRRKPPPPSIPGCNDPKVPIAKPHPSHAKAAMDAGATAALAPTQASNAHTLITSLPHLRE